MDEEIRSLNAGAGNAEGRNNTPEDKEVEMDFSTSNMNRSFDSLKKRGKSYEQSSDKEFSEI